MKLLKNLALISFVFLLSDRWSVTSYAAQPTFALLGVRIDPLCLEASQEQGAKLSNLSEPVARIEPKQMEVVVGENAIFTSKSYHPDQPSNRIVNQFWSGPDNQSGKDLSFIINTSRIKPGNFEIVLEVTDNRGHIAKDTAVLIVHHKAETLADLTVEKIEVSDERPKLDSEIQVKAVVRNLGKIPVDNAEVNITIGEKHIHKEQITRLNAGEMREIVAPLWKAKTIGSQEITVSIESPSQTKEITKANNIVKRPIVIGAASKALITEKVIQITIEEVEFLGEGDDIKVIVWAGQVRPFGHELRMFRGMDFSCHNRNKLPAADASNSRCSLTGTKLPWVAQYPAIDPEKPAYIRIELWDEDKEDDAGSSGYHSDDAIDINPYCHRCVDPAAAPDVGVTFKYDLKTHTYTYKATEETGAAGESRVIEKTGTAGESRAIEGNSKDGEEWAYGRVRFKIEEIEAVPVIVTITEAEITDAPFLFIPRVPPFKSMPWAEVSINGVPLAPTSPHKIQYTTESLTINPNWTFLWYVQPGQPSSPPSAIPISIRLMDERGLNRRGAPRDISPVGGGCPEGCIHTFSYKLGTTISGSSSYGVSSPNRFLGSISYTVETVELGEGGKKPVEFQITRVEVFTDGDGGGNYVPADLYARVIIDGHELPMTPVREDGRVATTVTSLTGETSGARFKLEPKWLFRWYVAPSQAKVKLQIQLWDKDEDNPLDVEIDDNSDSPDDMLDINRTEDNEWEDLPPLFDRGQTILLEWDMTALGGFGHFTDADDGKTGGPCELDDPGAKSSWTLGCRGPEANVFISAVKIELLNRRVVIFAIDGLRRDVFDQYVQASTDNPLLEKARAPSDSFLRTLLASDHIEAEKTRNAFPTETLPNWASVFTGNPPGIHGITNNYTYYRDIDKERDYFKFCYEFLGVDIGDCNRSKDLAIELLGFKEDEDGQAWITTLVGSYLVLGLATGSMVDPVGCLGSLTGGLLLTPGPAAPLVPTPGGAVCGFTGEILEGIANDIIQSGGVDWEWAIPLIPLGVGWGLLEAAGCDPFVELIEELGGFFWDGVALGGECKNQFILDFNASGGILNKDLKSSTLYDKLAENGLDYYVIHNFYNHSNEILDWEDIYGDGLLNIDFSWGRNTWKELLAFKFDCQAPETLSEALALPKKDCQQVFDQHAYEKAQAYLFGYRGREINDRVKKLPTYKNLPDGDLAGYDTNLKADRAAADPSSFDLPRVLTIYTALPDHEGHNYRKYLDVNSSGKDEESATDIDDLDGDNKRTVRDTQLGALARVDRFLTDFVKQLQENPDLYNNTLFMLVADHGQTDLPCAKDGNGNGKFDSLSSDPLCFSLERDELRSVDNEEKLVDYVRQPYCFSIPPGSTPTPYSELYKVKGGGMAIFLKRDSGLAVGGGTPSDQSFEGVPSHVDFRVFINQVLPTLTEPKQGGSGDNPCVSIGESLPPGRKITEFIGAVIGRDPDPDNDGETNLNAEYRVYGAWNSELNTFCWWKVGWPTGEPAACAPSSSTLPGGGQPLSILLEPPYQALGYIDPVSRLRELNNLHRSGDVILLTRDNPQPGFEITSKSENNWPGYLRSESSWALYFDSGKSDAWHGNLSRQDTNIPIYIWGQPLEKIFGDCLPEPTVRPVPGQGTAHIFKDLSSIDLVPTILDLVFSVYGRYREHNKEVKGQPICNKANLNVNAVNRVYVGGLLPVGIIPLPIKVPIRVTTPQNVQTHTTQFSMRLTKGDDVLLEAPTTHMIGGNRLDFIGWSKRGIGITSASNVLSISLEENMNITAVYQIRSGPR